MCSNFQIFYPTCAHTHTHCMHPMSHRLDSQLVSSHPSPPRFLHGHRSTAPIPKATKSKKPLKQWPPTPSPRPGSRDHALGSHRTRHASTESPRTHSQPSRHSFANPQNSSPCLMIPISHPVRLYDALFLAFYARGLGASGSASPSWLKTNRPFEV